MEPSPFKELGKVEGWINFFKALIDQGSIVYISVVGCKGPFHYYLYPHAL